MSIYGTYLTESYNNELLNESAGEEILKTLIDFGKSLSKEITLFVAANLLIFFCILSGGLQTNKQKKDISKKIFNNAKTKKYMNKIIDNLRKFIKMNIPADLNKYIKETKNPYSRSYTGEKGLGYIDAGKQAQNKNTKDYKEYIILYLFNFDHIKLFEDLYHGNIDELLNVSKEDKDNPDFYVDISEKKNILNIIKRLMS